jgi:hypothetical protein
MARRVRVWISGGEMLYMPKGGEREERERRGEERRGEGEGEERGRRKVRHKIDECLYQGFKSVKR